MKLITAIIKPFKLDDVRQAIADIGVQGVTVRLQRSFPGGTVLSFGLPVPRTVTVRPEKVGVLVAGAPVAGAKVRPNPLGPGLQAVSFSAGRGPGCCGCNSSGVECFGGRIVAGAIVRLSNDCGCKC